MIWDDGTFAAVKRAVSWVVFGVDVDEDVDDVFEENSD